MIELTTLGAIELRRDGIDVRSVLSQPKRLALLVYLRLAAPAGYVSRDRLLALFWPESDDDRARNALRQSLHFLRRSLGDDVVLSRAEHEVGIDACRVDCDATAFLAALEDDRLEDAIERYRGELLSGFHLDDAPGLERWLGDTRRELARRAVHAAGMLAERAEAEGQLATAALWARRAVTLDPVDEAGVRRLMELLARSGERGRALEAFAELTARLAAELDLEPSSDTAALAERVRAGRVAVATPSATPPPTRIAPAAHEPRTPPGAQPPSTAPASAAPGPPPRSGQPPPRRPRMRSDRRRHPLGPGSLAAVAAAALVVVVAAGLRIGHWRSPRSPDGTDPSPAIAVMPFLDMSEAGDSEYLSDGIAEELLNVLARVPGLRVAARTSSFAFRDGGATADSIGRALRVSHLLEGSVRTDGDRIRVTVQLIETRTGYHRWSETYDRAVGDIFLLQDDISREVADRLRLDLTPAEPAQRAEAVDEGAYELHLRGRHAWNRRTPESVRSAVELFQQAVERDPGYARAWAGLAEALAVSPQYQGLPVALPHARAEAAALRAIALDSTLAEPHAALGFLATFTPGDSAEAHFREALRLSPNYATAHHWYSVYFGERGRYRDQLRQILLARDLDPLSPIIQLNVARAYLHLRQFDDAIEAYRQLLATEPDFGFGHAFLAEALACAGFREEAAEPARRALELLGDRAHAEVLTAAGYALALAGQEEPARRVLRRLEAAAEKPGVRPGAWGPAQVHAALGDHDRALAWIERAVREDHWGGRPDLPWFDPLRREPRFLDSVRRFDELRTAAHATGGRPGPRPAGPQ